MENSIDFSCCAYNFQYLFGIQYLFKDNNRIENYGSNKGPSQTKAMAGVRVYLKRHYLKDPDSYEGISWEAFGTYNKDNNTYFALHKYRAKTVMAVTWWKRNFLYWILTGML